jgi:hypothetical protein
LANLSDLIISCLKLVKNTEHLYRPQADPFEFPDSFCLDVPENAGSYSSLYCPQNPCPEIPKLIRITCPPPPPHAPATRASRTPTFPSMLVRTPPPRKMHIWISLIETPGSASKLRSEFKILIRCMHHWLYHVSVLELFLIKEVPAAPILSLNNYTRRGPHLYSRRRWSVGQTVRRRSFLMYIFNLLVMRGKMIVL